MDGKELNAFLNKILLNDKEEDLREFLSMFEFTYCLVDDDGYSIDLIYSHEHMAVYYYHRQKKEGFISVLGIVDWKIEMMRFMERIQQFFEIDLFEFENRI